MEKRFFPLDEKLGLRPDHWSEGAAQVIVRSGLQAASFTQAAEWYQSGVGGSVSGESVRLLTEGWGKKMEEKRREEVEKVYAEEEPQAVEAVVQPKDPLEGMINVSSDGGMVLIREEGWKEAKMSVFSGVVQEKEASEEEQSIRLEKHSYQVGLWDAESLGQHQYLEGARRGIGEHYSLTSVNDGAPWIERVTRLNYPQAVMILDWQHACEHLRQAGYSLFEDQPSQAKQWSKEQIERLWYGQADQVIETLNAAYKGDKETIRQTSEYFSQRRTMVDYVHFRQQGFPVGSGTVESGINTVVHHRMKRQGPGWERNNAQGMLAALGELHSGRFESSWRTLTPH